MYIHALLSLQVQLTSSQMICCFIFLVSGMQLFVEILQANEVLLMNKQLSAKEAKECGLVTDYFPSANFEAETKQRILEFSKLPPMVCHFNFVCLTFHNLLLVHNARNVNILSYSGKVRCQVLTL